MAPTWRQLFDSWEKAVAPGLEEMTASTEFREGMASVTKLSAAARRRVEQASRQWMHAWNMPTATDVRKLRRQISALEGEVAALRRTTQKANGVPPSNRREKLAAIDEAIAAAANGTVSKGTVSKGTSSNGTSTKKKKPTPKKPSTKQTSNSTSQGTSR